MGEGPYHIARLDSSDHQGDEPHVIGADISQNLAVLAGPEVLDKPPSQAVDDVGQLRIRDCAEAGSIRGRGDRPQAVRSIRSLAGQPVDYVRHQIALPAGNVPVIDSHGA